MTTVHIQKGVIRLLTGAFLIVTVIAPLAKVKIQDLQDYLGDISLQSEAVVAEGENLPMPRWRIS